MTENEIKINVHFTKKFGFSCDSVEVIEDFKQRGGMIRFDFGMRTLEQMKTLWAWRHHNHFGW